MVAHGQPGIVLNAGQAAGIVGVAHAGAVGADAFEQLARGAVPIPVGLAHGAYLLFQESEGVETEAGLVPLGVPALGHEPVGGEGPARFHSVHVHLDQVAVPVAVEGPLPLQGIDGHPHAVLLIVFPLELAARGVHVLDGEMG